MNKWKINFIGIIAIATIALVSPALGQLTATEKNLMENAQKLYQAKDLPAAKETLDKIIKSYPKNYVAYFLRGELKLFFLRDLEAAFSDTDIAIKLGAKAEGIEKAYNNRGVIFQFQGKDDEALMDFEKAIALNSIYAPPHNGRAVILERKNRIDEALKEFDTYIKLERNPIAGYAGRGDILFKRNDLEGALTDSSKVVLGDQQFPSSWIRRGYIYGALGFWESSFSDIRKGFELLQKPEHRFSRVDVTLGDLDAYIRLYPRNANALATRGLINLWLSKDSAAETDLLKSYEIDGTLKEKLKNLIEFIRKTRQ